MPMTGPANARKVNARQVNVGTHHFPAMMLTTVLLVLATSGIRAAEPRDDWRCAQAPDSGRWSCSRDGVTADSMLDSAHASAAEPAQVSPTLPAIESEAIEPAATDSGTLFDPQAGLPIETVAADAVVPPDTRPAETPPTEVTTSALASPASTEVATDVATTTEPAGPTIAPEPAAEPEAVDDPAVQDDSVANLDATPGPGSEPSAEPSPAPTPVAAPDLTNAPAFQRLAYVPDQPTSLLDLPGEFWVAQIMAVSSKEFLEAYAEEHDLRGLSAARIASGDRLFFVLILGIYETKDLAEQAIADMPPPYDKFKPLLRTLASLQQAMRKADSMTGTADF